MSLQFFETFTDSWGTGDYSTLNNSTDIMSCNRNVTQLVNWSWQLARMASEGVVSNHASIPLWQHSLLFKGAWRHNKNHLTSSPCLSPKYLRARKQQQTKLFVAEKGQFGTPFLTPSIPPKKFMWVPFCVLSQEMRHINQNGGFGWGPKGLCWTNYVLFHESAKRALVIVL